MKTAKEHLQENLPFGMLFESAVIHTINQARSELIREIARKIKSTDISLDPVAFKEELLLMLNDIK